MFSAFKKLVSAKASPPPAPAPPPAWKRQGNDALARGALDEAAAFYLQGTMPPPGDPLAWLNLGYVRLEQGQRPAAMDSLMQAGNLLPDKDPALIDVWCLSGRERQEELDWAGARTWFTRVVQAEPTHALAWRELGVINDKLCDGKEAAACLLRAITLSPDFADALGDLSEIEFRAERYPESLRWADQMLAVTAQGPRMHFLRARPLWKLGQLEEALLSLDRGLAHGEDETAVYLRSLVAAEMGLHEEAQASRDRSRELAMNFAKEVGNRAAAGQLQPSQVTALAGKAMLLHDLGCLREALKMFEAALAMDAANADLRLSRSFTLFLLGDYAAAWAGYEYRWEVLLHGKLNERPDFGAPQWQGESLAGRTIIVYHEQGLGDSIQFMRYVPLLAGDAGEVLFYLQDTVASVTPDLPHNCRLMKDGENAPAADFACALLSLPGLFKTTLTNIPTQVPYLRTPDAATSRWAERLGPRRKKLRVGLVWSGNRDQINDFKRSMPLEEIRRLAPTDIEFFSLQKDLRDSDRQAMDNWPALTHFGAELQTFMDTAALACLMDVIVSVDTSVAHLAGALGRPLCVMLSFVPDWRWGLESAETPWYPSAKLFRQPAAGQWTPAVQQVMDRLRSMSPGLTSEP